MGLAQSQAEGWDSGLQLPLRLPGSPQTILAPRKPSPHHSTHKPEKAK